jgi:hypothetical protein
MHEMHEAEVIENTLSERVECIFGYGFRKT